MQLPMNVGEVTPAWLSEALSRRWPGIEVRSVRYADSIAGTATKVRLEIDYGAGQVGGTSPPPPSVFIKFGESAFQLDNVASLGLYDNEVLAYGQALPSPAYGFDFPRPDCYFAGVQKSPAQGVMLLEDLTARNVRINSALQPLNGDQAQAALSTLAQLHGKSWGKPELERLLPIQEPTREMYTKEVDEVAPKLFGLLRGHVVPFTYRNQHRYSAAWKLYLKMIRSGPQCMLHGDAHVGNSYTQTEGSVGFLDWQMMGRGRWIADVAYFIVSALDVEDRQKLERDLLRHYLAKLASHGVRVPTFDDAFQDYRRAILYSLVVWLGNPDLCQPPAINLTCLARTSHALIEHRTLEAFGV